MLFHWNSAAVHATGGESFSCWEESTHYDRFPGMDQNDANMYVYMEAAGVQIT